MGLFSTSVEAPDYGEAIASVQQGMQGALTHTQNAGDFEKQWLQQALQLQERQFGIQQRQLRKWQNVSRQDLMPYANAGYDAMDALMGTLGLPTWSAGTYNVMNALESDRRIKEAKAHNRDVDMQLAQVDALYPDFYYTDINPDGTIRSLIQPPDQNTIMRAMQPSSQILSPETRGYYGPQYSGPNGPIGPYNTVYNQGPVGQAGNPAYGRQAGNAAAGGQVGNAAGGAQQNLGPFGTPGTPQQGQYYNPVYGYSIAPFPGTPGTSMDAYNNNLPVPQMYQGGHPANAYGSATPGVDFRLLPGYNFTGSGQLVPLSENAQVGGVNWDEQAQKETLWNSFMDRVPVHIAQGYNDAGSKVSDREKAKIMQLYQNLQDVGPYEAVRNLSDEDRALVEKYMSGTLERSVAPQAEVLSKFFNTPAYALAYGSTGAAVDPYADPLDRFQVSPSYQFDIDQQTKLLENRASSRGLMKSTGLAQDMADYIHGKANQEYNNYQSNLQNMFGNYQQQLASVAGLGANASQAMSSGAQNYGQMLSNSTFQNTGQLTGLMGGIGTALGNSELAQGNIIQNAMNQIASLQAAQAEADAAAKNASSGGGIGNILGSIGGKIAGAATNYALGSFFA